MSITGIRQELLGFGQTIRVYATSDLADVIAFYWYLDGVWIGRTTIGQFDFYLEAGTQGLIDVVDTNDPDFDPIASAPASYPARRTLFWVRSVDPVIDYYRVEQQRFGQAWEILGIVEGAGTEWAYTWVTDRLLDFGLYSWRIVPVAIGGMEGTPVALAEERVLRTPDAPNFSAEWDSDTLAFTIAEAT